MNFFFFYKNCNSNLLEIKKGDDSSGAGYETIKRRNISRTETYKNGQYELLINITSQNHLKN